MGTIGYGYGSEWHLLRYLGYHRNRLNEHILRATGTVISRFAEETNEEASEATSTASKVGVHWLDHGFSSVREPLHDDREFGGVYFDQVGTIHVPLRDKWSQYWPASGTPPQWDAVARLSTRERDHGLDTDGEWLLVEAKAHLGELETQCKASDSNSLAMIRRALDATAKAVTHHGKPTSAWMEKYYQYANRLAALNFLSEYRLPPGQSARLILLYFYGELEEKMPGRDCSQSAAEWRTHLDTVYSEMDLDLQSPLMQRVHPLFLSVNPRAKPIKPQAQP